MTDPSELLRSGHSCGATPVVLSCVGVAPQLLRSGHSRYGNSFPNAKCLFLSGLPPVIALVFKVIPSVWVHIANLFG